MSSAQFIKVVAGLALALQVALGAAATPALAQRQPQEIKLTEQQLVKLLNSMKAAVEFQETWSKEIERIMPEGDAADDPKAQAEYNRKLHAIQDKFARSQGFASADEYADVNHTFTKLNAGIDPKTGKWVENTRLRSTLESFIAGIEADKAMPAPKKKAAIEQHRRSIDELKSPRHAENVELFNKLRPRIDAAVAAAEKVMQQMQERETK